DPARDALEEADVRDRRGQVDVAHPLAADLLARHLDAAALADDALVTDALVLAAVALPVLRRTEDALAEEAVPLGLERAVVDRLRLRHFSGRPVANLLARRQSDPDGVEIIDVDQVSVPLLAALPLHSSLRRPSRADAREGFTLLNPRLAVGLTPPHPRALRAARLPLPLPPLRSPRARPRRRRGHRAPRRPGPSARRPGRRAPGPPRPPRPGAGAPPPGASPASGRCRAPPRRGAARRPPHAPRPPCPRRRGRGRRARATASPSAAP